MIKLILKHVLSLEQSQRLCTQALGVSKGVVAKYGGAEIWVTLDNRSIGRAVVTI